MPVAAELSGVSFAYAGGPTVLRDVNLTVDLGEFVAVAGPNGGGKTTLLRVLLGLEQPQTGTASLFGEPATRLSERFRISYLAQRAQHGIDSPVTVEEIVAAGRVPRRGPFGGVRQRDQALIRASIERVGLAM